MKMFTDVHMKVLTHAIYQTWGAVAADLPEEIDNQEAMEVCIDADRLESLGNSWEANEILKDAIKMHGYSAVFDFLCSEIQVL